MKDYIFVWLLRLIVALIFLQTLYFKFNASPESVYIFSALNMEPYGRISIGVAELLVAVFLLIPKTSLAAAIGGTCILLGAIFAHLFVLGIEVKNDGATLFILALIAFLCCATLVVKEKNKLINWFN